VHLTQQLHLPRLNHSLALPLLDELFRVVLIQLSDTPDTTDKTATVSTSLCDVCVDFGLTQGEGGSLRGLREQAPNVHQNQFFSDLT